MIASLGINWEITLAVTAIVILAMVLTYRLVHRDPRIKSTRYGVFIDREKFPEEPEEWPELRTPPPERTLPQWPEKTQELPPKEEK